MIAIDDAVVVFAKDPVESLAVAGKNDDAQRISGQDDQQQPTEAP